ncbi:radical SAM protein [Caballeronia sp. ATUFL_F1_KS39]|uniref:radical SAM/SPASM domain-containing protein n=1 Tax=Caballeronia sp. ATUFL_F1_KS39 TaxID=2921766 RepID=UPI0020279F5D|nr:radical SAM protein [Caballeronia sp. ATUFL_F1_KS39]
MMERLTVLPAPQQAPLVRRFTSRIGTHVLFVPGSRIYDLTDSSGDGEHGDDVEHLVSALAETFLLDEPVADALSQVVAPAPQSISLNVSSSCNLSCSYCYAGRGEFDGAQPKPMRWETARAAIDRLLAMADASAPVTVGFLGGEPFVNRNLVHQAVTYAAEAGRRSGLDVRFSVTTNGTLLNEADRQLLRSHPFAVTISVDGGAATHERLRPFFRNSGDGTGSHARLRETIAPLLDRPGQARIAARATATRMQLDIAHSFDAILALGFEEAGFAPLRRGPEGSGVLQAEDWPVYSRSLAAVARTELTRVTNGGALRLTNLAVALKQLHRGASSPYPCGAGGGYFSVAANGDWYTCHRAIGDAGFKAGDSTGLDRERRKRFLQARHVHAQTECATCWARYLCAGGCHQEAAQRTEASCDFIRGWLEFCLAAYCELSTSRPGWFNGR